MPEVKALVDATERFAAAVERKGGAVGAAERDALARVERILAPLKSAMNQPPCDVAGSDDNS